MDGWVLICRDLGMDSTVDDILKDLCSRCYRSPQECKCSEQTKVNEEGGHMGRESNELK